MSRWPKVPVSKDVLESLYYDKALPVEEVQRRLGLSSLELVYYYVNKYGLTRRRKEGHVRQMGEVEKSWLACAIDGEGTIGLQRNRGNWTSPLVEVSNTDNRFVARCYEISGVMEPRLKTDATERHSACWQWRVRNIRLVRDILEQLEPHLVIKKDQARIVLDFLATRPYEAETALLKIHQANRKGPT